VASAGNFVSKGIKFDVLDAAGNVRIWDVTQREKILKGEYRALAGSINDLCWDSESKHLIVVGEGRDKYFNFLIAYLFIG
jgi:esterase/lipase